MSRNPNSLVRYRSSLSSKLSSVKKLNRATVRAQVRTVWARPPRWVGRAPSIFGQLPFGQQLGRLLLTEMASRGTNAVLPSGVAVLLMRNQ